ncbi:uncharacterized protein LOC143211527 isoform X2 [Lasioglossum baleicum]|uniref:uncharacterized protein LOC143211527 isoform X2 n=1 Tax=Lasioglossum baleicum TaxID=434251 RepID=UPI003FCE9240
MDIKEFVDTCYHQLQSQIAAQSGRSLHGQASQQIPDNLQVRSTIQSRETQEDSDLLRVQVVPVQMQEIEIEEAEDEVLLLQELSLRLHRGPRTQQQAEAVQVR